MERQLDDRCRCLHCVNIVMDLFPKILQRIMESRGMSPQSLFNIIQKDFNFKKKLTQSDHHTIQTLSSDGYTKLDVTLIFKIITHFSNMFLTPPTRGWASNPQPNEITIGDDAQRLRLTRNHFFHKIEATVRDTEYNDFFNKVNKICERMDKHLNLTENNSLTSLLQSFVVPPWDRLPNIEQQYREQQSLTEFLIIDNGNRNFTVYQTGSMKELIQALNSSSQDPMNESVTEPITLTFPEITNLDVVKHVEEELKDEINSGFVNIKIIRASDGSFVLDITVRKTVLKNKEQLKQELELFLKKLLTHEKIPSLSQTRHAIISENYVFCNEQDVNDAGLKTGRLKLHLQVKSAILQSEEAFKGEIQHLLGAMASKSNGSQIFQSDPVVAVLEPDTEFINTTIENRRPYRRRKLPDLDSVFTESEDNSDMTSDIIECKPTLSNEHIKTEDIVLDSDGNQSYNVMNRLKDRSVSESGNSHEAYSLAESIKAEQEEIIEIFKLSLEHGKKFGKYQSRTRRNH